MNHLEKAISVTALLAALLPVQCLDKVCDNRDPYCGTIGWLAFDSAIRTCMDAAVVNTSGVADFLYVNDGSGNFFARELFPGDGLSGNGVDSGDFNGDGLPDIFVANSTAGLNRYYINRADLTGTFSGASADADTDNTNAVTVADFNGDGFLDALVVNSGGATPRLYLNDGFGNFPLGINAGTDAFSSLGVDSGDLDGDGDIDAFIANGGGGANRLYLNDGNGNFTGSDATADLNNSRDVVLGDLDGDGDLDAFVVNDAGPNNKVYVNQGDGTFVSQNAGPSVAANLGLDLGDLDGDGDLDAFVVSSGSPAIFYRNDGGLIFTELNATTDTDTGADVALGDLDGDGDLDAFAVNDAGGQQNRVYINESGTFTSRLASADANPSQDVVLRKFEGVGCQ